MSVAYRCLLIIYVLLKSLSYKSSVWRHPNRLFRISSDHISPAKEHDSKLILIRKISTQLQAMTMPKMNIVRHSNLFLPFNISPFV